MTPPVAPERLEWVNALEVVLVAKLTRGIAGVSLDVDVGVAAFFERLQAGDVALNDGRLNARDSELAKRKPCSGLVDVAGDALAPVLLVEDEDAARGLLYACASMFDCVEAGSTDQLALLVFDNPDSPDHRVFVCTHAVVPFQFVLEYRRRLSPQKADDRVALHAAGGSELAHDLFVQGRKFYDNVACCGLRHS